MTVPSRPAERVDIIRDRTSRQSSSVSSCTSFGNAFGASQVQGFAITLGMGLVINLFTAVIATRTIPHTIVILAGNRLRESRELLGV